MASRADLLKRILEKRIEFTIRQATLTQVLMHGSQDVFDTQLSERQPGLHGFEHQGPDIFGRRIGLGSQAILGCRRTVCSMPISVVRLCAAVSNQPSYYKVPLSRTK